MELNISKCAGDNLDWQRNEWGQHGYTEIQTTANWGHLKRTNQNMLSHCWGKKEAREKGGKRKRKMHNMQMSNVELKVDGDWMKSSVHACERKACIQSATSLNLAVGSSSEYSWASVPDLLSQCCGKEGHHTPAKYFMLSEKPSVSKNGITSSVAVSRSLQLYWKSGNAQERAKVLFKKLENWSDFSSLAWSVSPQVYLRGALSAENTETFTGKWQWGLGPQGQITGELI